MAAVSFREFVCLGDINFGHSAQGSIVSCGADYEIVGWRNFSFV